MVRGGEGGVGERGIWVLMGKTENRLGGLPTILRAFRGSRVEGVIFAAMYHREADDFGAAIAGPSVLVNCFTALADVSTVLPDDEEGGHVVGRHLLELGHRRIGSLTLWPEIAAVP